MCFSEPLKPLGSPLLTDFFTAIDNGVVVGGKGGSGSSPPPPLLPAKSTDSATSYFRQSSISSLGGGGGAVGMSRGPSPLTIGASDVVPLAVAFQEVCHACFRGAEESQVQVLTHHNFPIDNEYQTQSA